MSRYFSNGTEGEAWTSAWCDSCKNDHGAHGPDGSFGDVDETHPLCPLLATALAGLEVPEWTERRGPPFHLPPDVVCSDYTPCTSEECTGDPQPAARDAARARVAAIIAEEEQ